MATGPSEAELRGALGAARTRLSDAARALALGQRGAERAEMAAAREAVLEAERALAASRNEPHAVPLEFPVQWDTGAPLPFLLQNDYRTFLVFAQRDVAPRRDGTSPRSRNADDPNPGQLAIVEFRRCVCTRMGTPNEEVFRGHPLSGSGFEGYRPLSVRNSTWIRELEAMNAVHPRFNPRSWSGLSHYIFGFHDSTFECVAKSFVVESRVSTFPDALRKICEKIAE